MKMSTFYFIVAAITFIVSISIRHEWGRYVYAMTCYFIGVAMGTLSSEKKVRLLEEMIDKYKQMCRLLGVDTDK